MTYLERDIIVRVSVILGSLAHTLDQISAIEDSDLPQEDIEYQGGEVITKFLEFALQIYDSPEKLALDILAMQIALELPEKNGKDQGKPK